MRKRIIMTLVVLSLLFCLTPSDAFADSTSTGLIPVNTSTFGDASFVTYLELTFDTNSDHYFSAEEISNVKSIDVSNMFLDSVKGLSYFTSLEKFNCKNNNLTTLDMSNCTALRYLECSYNQIMYLNLDNDTALSTLYCTDNCLLAVNLETFPLLGYPYVWCGGQSYTPLGFLYDGEIDLSWMKNYGFDPSKASHFCNYCDKVGNYLTFDPETCILSGLKEADEDGYYTIQYEYDTGIVTSPHLTTCHELRVKQGDVTIDAKNFPDDTFRDYVSTHCDTNGSGSLSAAELCSVTSIDVGSCRISTLKGLEHFTRLSYLDCCCNELTSLDVSGNVALTTLVCYSNPLTTLDVSQNKRLTYLDCENCKLTSLDVSNLKENSPTLNSDGSSYTLTAEASDGKVSLAELSANGFVPAKASDFTNGTTKLSYNASTGILSGLDTFGTDGYYHVQYAYNAGKSQTAYFNLLIKSSISITSQPKDAAAAVGKTVKMSVAASGTGLTYQWQFRTSSTGTWKNSTTTGYNTNTIKIAATAARNGYQYRCIIKDANGHSVTSNPAALNVLAITAQPKAVTAAAGTTAQMSVTATGTDLTYQWQFRKNSTGTWTNSTTTGYNTNTIKIAATAARNGYQYRCIVKDSDGNSVTSNAATLTVTSALAITTQPKNVTAAAGTTAQMSVTATGTGLTYQWQFRKSSTGTWTNSTTTGYNTNTIKIAATAARNGYQYRCIVKDSDGNSVTSNAAALTVK